MDFPVILKGDGMNVIFNDIIPVTLQGENGEYQISGEIPMVSKVEIIPKPSLTEMYVDDSYEYVFVLKINGVHEWLLDLQLVYESLDKLNSNRLNYITIVDNDVDGEIIHYINYYDLVILLNKVVREFYRNKIIMPMDYKLRDDDFNSQRILKLFK